MILNCGRMHFITSASFPLTRLLRVIISSLGITGLCSLGFIQHVSAADQIVLNYRWLQRSISVEELSTFAASGETSRKLRRYLDAIDEDPDNLRRTLNREINLDPVMLDRILNHPLGNLALDQLSPVIHTRSGEGDREALRAALILSASDDEKISLMELIEIYPTQEIHIEGDRLVEFYEDISALRDRIERWTAWLDTPLF